jgi:hypothetical protein
LGGQRKAGDKPLVVIASRKPNPAFGEAAETFQQYRIEQSRAPDADRRCRQRTWW